MATDYYRLRVQGLHQTEYNECVMYFKGVNLDVADYLENAQDLLTTWLAEFQDFWDDMLPVSHQTLRVSAAKASAGGGAEITTQYAMGGQAGTVSGGAASQQLCPVVRLIPPMGIKTAGKIFLPCIAESQIDGNSVDSTWLANLATLMTALIGPTGTSSIQWNLVVYSRKNNVFSDVMTYDTSPIVGFQRRRQRSPL